MLDPDRFRNVVDLTDRDEITRLFGHYLGDIHPGMFACDDSLFLKKPMGHTIISESAETFVLAFSRGVCLSQFPDDMQKYAIRRCTNQEPRFQARIADQVKGITVAMDEKEHQHKLNQLNKLSFPVINR